MSHDPLRIIQISDTHLFADADKTLLGVNTQKSFQAVLNFLKTEAERIDFILHTGDIAQDASANAYTRVGDMVKDFNVPVYYIPGNHDDVKIMSQVYPYGTIFNDKHVILKTWHIILLNSQKPGEVAGYFDDSQLHYLEHCLKAYPNHYAMIVFHHHPMLIGCEWLDKLGVSNAGKFWELVSHYRNVKLILFGHIHQCYEQVINNIHCYATPSTCIQFKKQASFSLEMLPQGYRWLHLYENGRFETGIQRLPEYIGVFDVDAKGY